MDRPAHETPANERRESNPWLLSDDQPRLRARSSRGIQVGRVDDEVANSALVLPATGRLGPKEVDGLLSEVIDSTSALLDESDAAASGTVEVAVPGGVGATTLDRSDGA